MKKVSSADPRIRREIGKANSGADPLQGISEALKAVAEIPRLQGAIESLESENRRVWKMLEKIVDTQAGLEESSSNIRELMQYREEHKRVHQHLDMAFREHAAYVRENFSGVHKEMSGIKADILNRVSTDFQKIYANIVGLFKKDSAKSPEEREVEVKVELEQGSWSFDIQRDSRGLLEKVTASPRR